MNQRKHHDHAKRTEPKCYRTIKAAEGHPKDRRHQRNCHYNLRPNQRVTNSKTGLEHLSDGHERQRANRRHEVKMGHLTRSHPLGDGYQMHHIALMLADKNTALSKR